MKIALISLLLAGCATTSCPPLPTLEAGDDPMQHMALMAKMYAACAARR